MYLFTILPFLSMNTVTGINRTPRSLANPLSLPTGKVILKVSENFLMSPSPLRTKMPKKRTPLTL